MAGSVCNREDFWSVLRTLCTFGFTVSETMESLREAQ